VSRDEQARAEFIAGVVVVIALVTAAVFGRDVKGGPHE